MTQTHCFPFTGCAVYFHPFAEQHCKHCHNVDVRGHVLNWFDQHRPILYDSLKWWLCLLEMVWKWQSKRWSSPFFLLNSGGIQYETSVIKHGAHCPGLKHCWGHKGEYSVGQKYPLFISSSCTKRNIICATIITEPAPTWVGFPVLPLRLRDQNSSMSNMLYFSHRTILWLTKPATPKRHLWSTRYMFAHINACCFSPLPSKTATQK